MEQQKNLQETYDKLLDFFKVLGNEERLKIVGLLAQREWTLLDLARTLDLREPDVVRHLARLEELGLLQGALDEPGAYSFDSAALIRLKKEVFASESSRSPSRAGLSPEEKTLSIFVQDGRLIGIPAQHERRVAVAKWLAGRFEPGVRYAEKEVNEIIERVHHDSSSLRRYMVDYGYMQRDHGIYWRTAKAV